MPENFPTKYAPSFPLIRNAAWRAVVAAFALNGLLFGAWASRVPAFKEGFELNTGTLGVLLLALAGGAILSFPLAGSLSERWGADRLTIRCAWAYGPALVMLALAPNSVSLGVALFMFGAIHGAMDVAMNGWGAEVEKRMGRSTMSVFHAMFSLGAGVGAASGYTAAKLDFTPLVQFSTVAFLGCFIALFAMIPVQEKSQKIDERTGKGNPLIALPSRSLLLVGLIAFSVAMGEGAMADWSAVFLRVVSNATEAQAALGFAVFSAAMVLTRLSGSYIVERLGAIATTRLSGAVAFVGLAISVATDIFAVALAGFALVGIGYAVVMPLVFSRAASDPIMRPGPAIASVATLGYGGMLLGPPIVGFIAHVTSLKVSFGVLALLAVLALVLAPSLKVQETTRTDS